MRKTIAAFVITFGAIAASAAHAQTVSVTGGQIHGAMLEKGGAVFKGIPYAAPPVDDLRWRDPMPVKSWAGVREAMSFGSICAQVQGPGNPTAGRDRTAVAEDCLYLNVWTSEWPSSSRKPVMVWIYGGGNFGGASSEDRYDGEPLARRGVVLVSFNYRVGTFGFFSHPALTRESPHHASGNQGILDQIAALKWVRDNISKFGGDPDNVTIFGESAGSFDVSALMTSPLSNGLFQRAIGESGPAVPLPLTGEPHTLSQAEKRGENVASRWKLPPGASLRDLRAVPAAEILKAEPDYTKTVLTDFPDLGITVDGYVFPKKPSETFAAGQEHRVGLLLGSNARERVPGTAAPTDLKKTIDDTYGPLSARAQSLYVGERDPVYGSPADQWATDTSFRCTSVAQLVWHSTAGNPSYQFEFARVPTGREAQGATHASELNYVFGTLDIGITAARIAPTAVDRQVSDAIQRYWTNFAKTGDPNGPGLPAWPKFDPAKRSYIQFTDAGPLAKEGLRRPYCDLFIENVKRQMGR